MNSKIWIGLVILVIFVCGFVINSDLTFIITSILAGILIFLYTLVITFCLLFYGVSVLFKFVYFTFAAYVFDCIKRCFNYFQAKESTSKVTISQPLDTEANKTSSMSNSNVETTAIAEPLQKDNNQVGPVSVEAVKTLEEQSEQSAGYKQTTENIEGETYNPERFEKIGKWLKSQSDFSALCEQKLSLMPHCVNFNMNYPVSRIDCHDRRITDTFQIKLLCFNIFCHADDLDYTCFERIKDVSSHIGDFKSGNFRIPTYVHREITAFVTALKLPVTIFLFREEHGESFQAKRLEAALKNIGTIVQNVDRTDQIISNKVVVIDILSSELKCRQRCQKIIDKFGGFDLSIIYISFVSEISRELMVQLINKKNEEHQEKSEADEIRNINIEEHTELYFSNAIQEGSHSVESASKPVQATPRPSQPNSKTVQEGSRSVESASKPVQATPRPSQPNPKTVQKGSRSVESTSKPVQATPRSSQPKPKTVQEDSRPPKTESVKEHDVIIKKPSHPKAKDEELLKVIDESEKKIGELYKEGIVDNFGIQNVDYHVPAQVQDDIHWKYPVVKYPDFDNIVFPYRSRLISRRGYTEENFQSYIELVFKDTDVLILGDCNILPSTNSRPYEPDIAIICTSHPSIRIDVEIDEPYAGISRKPIHYMECGDDFRDLNLNNLGWIVIRFTEYQVYSNSKGCAAFIAYVLHTVNPSIQIPKSLVVFPELEQVVRWTEIESKVMASEKVREAYLHHDFGIVPNKGITSVDIKQTEIEKTCASLVKPITFKNDTNTNLEKTNNLAFAERDKNIQFFAFEHIYLYKGLLNFIPVSNIISYFFSPFDSNCQSAVKASQRHVPQGLVLEEWDCKGTKARKLGTFMHKQIENTYKGREYQTYFNFKYEGKYIHIDENVYLEKEYSQLKKFRKSHPFTPFRNEWTIYDEELGIAGTIDMIHKNGDAYDIYDWKRSLKILDAFGNPKKINSYGKHGINGLEEVSDTDYWHYCIQQNLYRYILEKKYGIKVGKMFLVVFIEGRSNCIELEVERMDKVISIIIHACRNGSIKTYLESLQNE